MNITSVNGTGVSNVKRTRVNLWKKAGTWKAMAWRGMATKAMVWETMAWRVMAVNKNTHMVTAVTRTDGAAMRE